ncbi:MAG TPA: S53 family peptidase [Solirubrobacteraceae bacterium]
MGRGDGVVVRRWAAAAFVAVLAALAAASLIVAGGAPGRVAAPRSPGPRPVGRTASSAVVHFSLVLRLPGQRRLERFLQQVYDPSSRAFHHFTSASAFGERFGVSRDALRDAIRSLRRDGVQVATVYPQHTAIDARAPAGVVERLFGVRLMDYRGPGGRRLHAPVGTPSVPAGLADTVSAVSGLDGRDRTYSDDVPSSGLDPTDASAAYDLAPLHAQGIDGQGEKVAVISFGTFRQSNLAGFDRQFGLPVQLPVDAALPPPLGGATDSSADVQEEVELDFDIAHEIASRAQLLDYNAPYVDGSGAGTFGALIDKIVADGQANIVSDSYGSCELSTDLGDVRRDEQAIEAAEAHGISIFKSAGDAGAYQCQRTNRADHRLSVEWPASSPGVVAVGGTSLSIGTNGGYAGETTWEGTLTQQGGGGGLSAILPRPSWQRGLGVDNQYSDGKRQVPDVSANGDTASGWTLFADGQLTQIGGTSASTPFWAASTALIEQYARQQGVRRLGFIDPVLYALASSPQRYPPFHDVTVGSNRFYPATKGWDFATGLGSPDVYNLARDVVAYLKAHGGG